MAEDEALKWLEETITRISNSEDETVFMFLVGGPGNGKSVIGNLMAASGDYELIERNSNAPHQRIYNFKISEKKILTILNDATMPHSDSKDSDSPLLLTDIGTQFWKRTAYLQMLIEVSLSRK